MEQNDKERYKYENRSDNKKIVGLILLAAGCLLLAEKMGAPVPGWIFTWPMILIVAGLLTGLKSKFHNPGAFIMLAVGGVFLIDQSMPALNFHNYIFPVLLIAAGLIYILRPKKTSFSIKKQAWEQNQWDQMYQDKSAARDYVPTENSMSPGDNSEYVDINAVFGGVKKIVLSKNFKGGEINSFMGGTELNLMQADIQQPVILEVNNIFGGTKLILPSNWDVKNEVTAVFGGIDDKRSLNTVVQNSGKTLILKGACVFGGIEVSNY